VDVGIGIVAIAGFLGRHRSAASCESISVIIVSVVDKPVAIVVHAVARLFFRFAGLTIAVVAVRIGPPLCGARVLSNHRSGARFDLLADTINAPHSIAARVLSNHRSCARFDLLADTINARHSIAARIGSRTQAKAGSIAAFYLQTVRIHDQRAALN
jgi:hypothetical protein